MNKKRKQEVDEKENRITSALCHTRKQFSQDSRTDNPKNEGKKREKRNAPVGEKGIRHQLIQEPTRGKNFQVLSTIRRTRLNMGEKGELNKSFLHVR